MAGNGQGPFLLPAYLRLVMRLQLFNLPKTRSKIGMKTGFKLVLISMLWGCLTVNVNAAQTLLEYEDVKITDTEFQNLIAMIVPEKDRKQFLANEERILGVLQDMFVARLLSQKAVKAGLDKDSALQFKIETQKERMLMQAMLTHMIEAIDAPDFEKQALDRFTANPEQFEIPERVNVSHILISPKEGRSQEEGLKLAQQLRAKALEEGADFAALAKEFSDDTSAATNGGDLGFFEAKKMVKPFADAAFAMNKPGEVSEPVETRFGYHILQFHDKKPAGKMKFETVKDKLIAEDKQKFKATERGRILGEVRGIAGVNVNSEAIHTFISAD